MLILEGFASLSETNAGDIQISSSRMMEVPAGEVQCCVRQESPLMVTRDKFVYLSSIGPLVESHIFTYFLVNNHYNI